MIVLKNKLILLELRSVNQRKDDASQTATVVFTCSRRRVEKQLSFKRRHTTMKQFLVGHNGFLEEKGKTQV